MAAAWQGWALLGVPLVTLVLIGVYGERMPWPVTAQPYSYVVPTAALIVCFLLPATLWVNFSNSGVSAPLPFVPLPSPHWKSCKPSRSVASVCRLAQIHSVKR